VYTGAGDLVLVRDSALIGEPVVAGDPGQLGDAVLVDGGVVSAIGLFKGAVPDPSVDSDSELMTGVNGVVSNADFGASENMTGVQGLVSDVDSSSLSEL
jgi:hypothetical protein